MKLETSTLPKVRVRSVISVGPHVHPSTGAGSTYSLFNTATRADFKSCCSPSDKKCHIVQLSR